jgi:hypothetical protein
MISVWWGVVAFIGGTWAGFFVAALMRMSADRQDPALYASDLVQPRSQPARCVQSPWHWGSGELLQRERSGP